MEVLAEKHRRQIQIAEFRNLLPGLKDLALVLNGQDQGVGCLIPRVLGTSVHVQ